MSAPIRGAHVVGATLVAAVLLGAAITPAGAWPIALTSEDTTFLNATRGSFPGDDDTLLIVGRQMCRQLYTGQPYSAVIDSTAGEYGATPDQAAIVLRAARGAYCTQAPG